MAEKWLIIGISGVTCGGKTTLATRLHKLIPDSIMMSQDTYFRDVNDPKHTWIKELNHINFDILSSLNMEKMLHDIKDLIKNRIKLEHNFEETNAKPVNLEEDIPRKIKNLHYKVLIIEGFCVFNYPEIEKLCDIKYYFTLEQEECYSRRIKRVYEPPDCPGYFEKCVWPEYLKHLEDIKSNVKNIMYFDGNSKNPHKKVLADIFTVIL